MMYSIQAKRKTRKVIHMIVNMITQLSEHFLNKHFLSDYAVGNALIFV